MTNLITAAAFGKTVRKPFLGLALLVVATACGSPEQRVESFTRDGDALFAEGDYIKAALEYRNALQINTNHIPALKGLLEVMREQENQEQIIAILNRIIELEESNAEARVELGRILLTLGGVERAVELSDEALALAPRSPGALALAAGLKLRTEDPAGAVSLAKQALDIDRRTTDAYAVLAAERLQAGDAPGALAFTLEGIAAIPESVPLRAIAIQIHLQQEEIDRAIEIYREIIALEPDNTSYKRNFAGFLARNARLDDAEQVLEAITREAPEDVEAKIDLVRTINTSRGAEAARERLNAFITEAPDQIRLQRFLAELEVSEGDREAALGVLDEIAGGEGEAEEKLSARARGAELLLRDGEKDEARSAIDGILSEDERQSEALMLRAQLAMEDRRLDDAVADLRTVLRDAPNAASAMALLARAHELRGSYDLADDRYADALRASNSNAVHGVNYAQFLLRRNRPEQAEEILGATLATAPSNIEAWRLLAQTRILRQDWIGAQQVADRIREIGDDPVIADQVQGEALHGLNQYNESLESFKNAHEAAPTSSRPLVALVRAHIRAGQRDEAVALLEERRAGNPNDALAPVLLANLAQAQGDSARAETLLLEAVRNDPRSILANQNLYGHYIRLGQRAKAGESLERAAQSLPGNVAIRLLQANFHELEQDYDAAIAVYEALLADQPNSQVVANNLASLISDHRSGQDDRARALALAQRFRDSQVPHFRDTLAWATHLSGDSEGAARILRGVVEQAPGEAIFHYHLGMSQLGAGNTLGARAALEQAVSLGEEKPFPGLDQAKSALADL